MYSKVMVVDDNPIDLYVAQRIIEKSNFAEDVQLMSSADEALSYLSKLDEVENLPEVIFLDINMPGINGFQFLEAYQNLPALLRDYCKIVMLTSSSHPDDMDRAARDANVFNYLHKPVTPQKLRSIEPDVETAE